MFNYVWDKNSLQQKFLKYILSNVATLGELYIVTVILG